MRNKTHLCGECNTIVLRIPPYYRGNGYLDENESFATPLGFPTLFYTQTVPQGTSWSV